MICHTKVGYEEYIQDKHFTKSKTILIMKITIQACVCMCVLRQENDNHNLE